MDQGGTAATDTVQNAAPMLMRISVGLSPIGLALFAASFLAPGFRPGDVVGANIGAGLVMMLAWACIAIGVAAGVGRVIVGPRRFRTAVTLVAIPVAGVWLLFGLSKQQQENDVDPAAVQVNIVNDGA